MKESLKRIFSLAPSATEILFFLGLGLEVVGVTEQCNWPEEARGRDRVGSFAYPDIEKIASLKPDLVVAYGRIHKRFLDKLRERNINTFLLAPRTVEDIFQEVERLCSLAGQPQSGRSLVHFLRIRVERVKERVSENERPRVFRLMGDDPITTPASSSYQYDAIVVAGGRPFNPDSEEAYIQISLEEVIRFNPEVIISCGRGRDETPKERCHGCQRQNPACQRVIEQIRDWEGWKDIDAVREGRIHTLPCQFICRPGPRLIEGIERMANFFWPQCVGNKSKHLPAGY
jgi:iron complex transport system substrate-binding protein